MRSIIAIVVVPGTQTCKNYMGGGGGGNSPPNQSQRSTRLPRKIALMQILTANLVLGELSPPEPIEVGATA